MRGALISFVERHQLHPYIDKVFEFEEADKALEVAGSFSAVGKVVVKV